MYTIYEDDVVATANWSARAFLIPPIGVDIEVSAVTLFVNDAIAAAGASALLERNFGMDNPFQFSGALTEQKSNSRSRASSAQPFQDVSDTTGMGGNFFGAIGGGPGRDSNSRWRPPRPWARIILDGDIAQNSFCLAMDRFQAAGQIGNAHMSYIMGYRFSYMGNKTMRLYRRPRTPGVWHYQQAQNRRLGQTAMVAASAPEYWVGYAPYSPNIRQEYTPPIDTLWQVAGGALEVQAVPADVTFSALSTAEEAANPNSATTTFSALDNAAIAPQAPAASTTYSAVSTAAEAANPNSATVTFSNPTKVAEVASPNSALTTFSSLTTAALAPQSNSALTTFSGIATGAEAVNISAATCTFSALDSAALAPTGKGTTTFSAVASLAEAVNVPSALTTFSGVSTAQWSAKPGSATCTFSALDSAAIAPAIPSAARTTFSGVSTLNWSAKPGSATVVFSSLANIAGLPLVIQSGASLTTYSGLASLTESLSSLATATFSGTASAKFTASPNSGTTTFNSLATVSETLTSPASLVTLSCGAFSIEEALVSPSATTTFNAPNITFHISSGDIPGFVRMAFAPSATATLTNVESSAAKLGHEIDKSNMTDTESSAILGTDYSGEINA